MENQLLKATEISKLRSERVSKLKEFQKQASKANEDHQKNNPNMSRSMKTLGDVYDILKLSRSMSTNNSHPLSSMLNRNLRAFDNIRYQMNKETANKIA